MDQPLESREKFLSQYVAGSGARQGWGVQDVLGMPEYASEQGNASFESWEQPHQSAYLRLLEREVDYHKDHQDLVEAEKVAKLIFQLEKHQTERWIIFSLQFESWLRHIKQEEMCERIKEERLRSGYYRRLRVEFP